MNDENSKEYMNIIFSINLRVLCMLFSLTWRIFIHLVFVQRKYDSFNRILVLAFKNKLSYEWAFNGCKELIEAKKI